MTDRVSKGFFRRLERERDFCQMVLKRMLRTDNVADGTSPAFILMEVNPRDSPFCGQLTKVAEI